MSRLVSCFEGLVLVFPWISLFFFLLHSIIISLLLGSCYCSFGWESLRWKLFSTSFDHYLYISWVLFLIVLLNLSFETVLLLPHDWMSTRKRGPPSPSQPPPPAKIPSTSQARNRSPKPVYFRINKIQVGEWTQDSSPIEGLRARIYGGSNRLVWELDHKHAGKRKIEIVLGNVSSMQFSFGNNATGVMEVEVYLFEIIV